MKALTIGHLAKEAGVNLETVRYYERRGLLPRPPRSPSGYRLFPAESRKRLRFIRRAQELGFSLREIRELLSLRLAHSTDGAAVRRRAEAKLADIEAKLANLPWNNDEKVAAERNKLNDECNKVHAIVQQRKTVQEDELAAMTAKLDNRLKELIGLVGDAEEVPAPEMPKGWAGDYVPHPDTGNSVYGETLAKEWNIDRKSVV